MAAPKRVREFVFILVPEEGVVERTVAQEAARACRAAFLRGFDPICPLLDTMSYLTPAERTLQLPAISRRWLRRCGKIWLQFPTDDETLDSLSFRILDENDRGAATRRPVYRLERVEEDVVPVAVNSLEIREILACNLTAGFASRLV